MKLKMCYIAILTFFVTTSCLSQKIVVDENNSEVTFNFYKKDVQGTISGLKGEIFFDTLNLGASYFKGSARVKTIKTGIFLRDKHLMTKRYFYAKQFPLIEFVSTNIEKHEDRFLVTGRLTIRGKSRNMLIEFEINDEMIKGFSSINLSSYGIDVLKKESDNRVDILFTFPRSAIELTKEELEAAPEEKQEDEEQ